MAKHGSGTQGFGRVSAHTRPSPYSPLQFRGGSVPTTEKPRSPAAPRGPGGAKRGRRVVFAVVVVGMVIAGVGFLALFRPTPLPVPRASSTPAATAVPDLGEQAKRPAPQPVAKRS